MKFFNIIFNIVLLNILLLSTLLFYPNTNSSSIIYIGDDNLSTSYEVANFLQDQKYIHSAIVFRIASKLLLLDSQIRRGEFFIHADANLLYILFYITKDENIYYRKISFIEGLTIKDYIKLLENNSYLSGKIKNTSQIKEGTMMPDTYFFIYGDDRNTIIKRAQFAMEQYLNTLWESRDKALPYNNKREALILASMVEKESGNNDERDEIAGVFVNRLNKRIKLQSDPTVAYGLGLENADGLLKTQLLTDTPYNTYTRYGLPKGPIGNPSRRSLDAAFHPNQTDNLYFVANGNGGHIFSKTLKEHISNVKRWRKIENQLRK